MAATVKVYVWMGTAPGSGTAVESPNDVIRHKLIDNNLKNTDNPCVRPNSGYHYSFKKSVVLYAEVEPVVSISNCTIYTDGANPWTDCDLFVGDQQTDTYEQGIIDSGDAESGQELTEYGQISSVTDIFSYVSGSSLTLDLSSSWDNTTGRITKFLCMQVRLGTSTTGGMQDAETLTFTFDEV